MSIDHAEFFQTFPSPQKIRIDILRIIAPAKAFPGICGVDVHQTHKTPYPFMVLLDALIFKHVLHPQYSRRGMLYVMSVHKPHNLKVLFRFPHRRVIYCALFISNILHCFLMLSPFGAFVHKLSKIYLRPAFLQAATKKSRSIVSSPILASEPFYLPFPFLLLFLKSLRRRPACCSLKTRPSICLSLPRLP